MISKAATVWTVLLLFISVLGLHGQTVRSTPQKEPSIQVPSARGSGADPRVGRDPREPINDDPLARLQAITRARGTASPEYSANTVGQAQKQSALQSRLAAAAAVPVWKPLGPTSDNLLQNGNFELKQIDSGRLRNILPDPQNANVVYVLSSGGGLWKTSNFTASHPTWRPTTDFVGSTSGGSAALRKASNTIYLGTGDPFDFAPGGFMLKSTNGANSWSAPVFLNDGAGNAATTVLDVKVDPGTSDVVLAGTDVGLFRSANGGQSYTLVAFAGKQVWSLAKSSAGWLASVQDTVQVFSRPIPSAGSTTLYVSTDHGATWNTTGSGFANGAAGRTTLAVAIPGSKAVYAFASTVLDQKTFSFDQLDLFRSVDGGKTFTALNLGSKTPVNPSVFQVNMDIMNGQAWYNQMVLVDPSDGSRNTVYIGGNLASAKTTDGGKTWRLNSDWLAASRLPYVHADFHCAAVSLTNGAKTIFLGSDGGVFVSQDNGKSWSSQKNQGLQDHLIYSLASRQNDADEVLIALQDLGTRYRLPGSTVYDQVYGGDGVGVGSSQAHFNVSLAGAEFQDVERCVTDPCDDTKKFEPAFNGTVQEFNFFNPYYTPYANQDPTGVVFFDESLTHVYKTTNGAVFWDTIGTIGGNVPKGFSFRDTVHAIGVSPKDLLHIGVAGSSGHVAITPDGGTTWNVLAMNTEVPGFASFVSNVTWASSSVVYATSVQPAPGAIRVVKSTKGGASGTWTPAQNGLPDTPINRLRLDTRDSTGRSLFATTDIGVYRTTDGGAHWSPFGTGLPQVQVSDIYLAPNGSFLRISTYGRGVWETVP